MILDKVEALPLKKMAVEAIMSRGADNEIIAERLIMLLNGDLLLLDYLVSGVPYGVKDAASVKLIEEYISTHYFEKVEFIDEIDVRPATVSVNYRKISRVWLKPDNIEGLKRIQSGSPTYNEDVKYSETTEYSMPCDYSNEAHVDLETAALLECGVEFKRL